MARLIDNQTLALLSLKDAIDSYLRNNGWKNLVNVFLVGEKNVLNKEYVYKVTDSTRQISIPIVVIGESNIYEQSEELGGENEKEISTLSLYVAAVSDEQRRILTSVLRKYLDNLVFAVYDYDSYKEQVSTGEISNVISLNVSDYDSSNLAEKFASVINAKLEIDSTNFI